MLLSIIEILSVILPILLAIAYLTLAERKVMGSMQRRVGPNKIGQIKNIHQKNIIKRFYHKSLILYDINKINNLDEKTIQLLYQDRVVPVKIFDKNKIIATCFNFFNSKERLLFLKQWKNKGGIYIIQYKLDPYIYYIGRTNNFSVRLKSHIKHKLNDKFHLFVTLVGWDKFKFSIIEECSLDIQVKLENKYLQEYLPLLNTHFTNNYSNIIIYNSLYDKLKNKQINLELLDNKYKGISIYVYKYMDTYINNNYQYFNSINNLNKIINIARATIRVYLNTNVPYKGLLFYTKPIKNFEITYKQVKKSSLELNLNHNIPKKVFIYSITPNGDIDKKQFDSREKVAIFLNVNTKSVMTDLDKCKLGGINGYYLFNKSLNEKELLNLVQLYSKKMKKSYIKVWVYNVKTMELIKEQSFKSLQKTAEYFNIHYRTVLKHLDTKLVTKQNGQLVLFFTNKLTEQEKKYFISNINKAKNATTEVWVYKKLNDSFIFINENKPTFSSKFKASKELNISNKKLSKILDTYECYKNLYFFSERLN